MNKFILAVKGIIAGVAEVSIVKSSSELDANVSLNSRTATT